MSDAVKSKPLAVGDIVYSLDDCSAGHGEESTIIEIHDTKAGPNPAPDWAPAWLYTIRTKSGYVLPDLLRCELSRKQPGIMGSLRALPVPFDIIK